MASKYDYRTQVVTVNVDGVLVEVDTREVVRTEQSPEYIARARMAQGVLRQTNLETVE
jgi:hypothetical protein